MRAFRAAALAIVALAGTAPAAVAAQPVDGVAVTGPVIGAGHLIWGYAEPPGGTDPLSVFAASEEGRVAVVASYPKPTPSWNQYFPRDEAGIAGSPKRFAYIREANDGTSDQDTESVNELWTGTAGGLRRIGSCWATSVDVEGDLVAWSELNECNGGQIFVQDLGAATPPEVIPAPVAAGEDVEIAGRYVAWSEKAFWETPKRNETVVYDRVAKAVVYRIDVEPLIPPDHPFGYEWHYELEPDGKLVLAYRRLGFGDSSRIAWFSPSEPTAHRIPVDLAAPFVSVANDLVGGCRREPSEAIVFDLNGTVVNHLDDTDPTYVCRVAFDGERVAWLNPVRKPALYFDRFPATAPELPPVVEAAPPPPATPSATGAVSLPERDVDCTHFAARACAVETTLTTRSLAQASGPRRLIGSSRYRVQAGHAARLRLRLTRAGRRLVRRAGKLRTRLTTDVETPLGERVHRTFGLTLLRRRR